MKFSKQVIYICNSAFGLHMWRQKYGKNDFIIRHSILDCKYIYQNECKYETLSYYTLITAR